MLNSSNNRLGLVDIESMFLGEIDAINKNRIIKPPTIIRKMENPIHELFIINEHIILVMIDRMIINKILLFIDFLFLKNCIIRIIVINVINKNNIDIFLKINSSYKKFILILLLFEEFCIKEI